MYLKRDNGRPLAAISGLGEFVAQAGRCLNSPDPAARFAARPEGLGQARLAIGLALALHAAIGAILLFARTPETLPPPRREVAVAFVEQPAAEPAQPAPQPAPALTEPPPAAVSPAPEAPPPPPPEPAPSPEPAAPPQPSPPAAVAPVEPPPERIESAQPKQPAPVSHPEPARRAPRREASHGPVGKSPEKPSAAPAQEAAPPSRASPAVIVLAHPVAGMSTNRPPAYPQLAQRRGEEGLVMLRVEVSADGQPRSVAVLRSSGHESLDDAAAAAVRQWRFVPATSNSTPIAAVAEVPVAFRLPH